MWICLSIRSFAAHTQYDSNEVIWQIVAQAEWHCSKKIKQFGVQFMKSSADKTSQMWAPGEISQFWYYIKHPKHKQVPNQPQFPTRISYVNAVRSCIYWQRDVKIHSSLCQQDRWISAQLGDIVGHVEDQYNKVSGLMDSHKKYHIACLMDQLYTTINFKYTVYWGLMFIMLSRAGGNWVIEGLSEFTHLFLAHSSFCSDQSQTINSNKTVCFVTRLFP